MGSVDTKDKSHEEHTNCVGDIDKTFIVYPIYNSKNTEGKPSTKRGQPLAFRSCCSSRVEAKANNEWLPAIHGDKPISFLVVDITEDTV